MVTANGLALRPGATFGPLDDLRGLGNAMASGSADVDRGIARVNGVVNDGLVDEGAQDLRDGNQAGFIWNGIKYSFYNTFMPNSVEGAAVNLAGGAWRARWWGLDSRRLQGCWRAASGLPRPTNGSRRVSSLWKSLPMRYARNNMTKWLKGMGISEGPGAAIQINRYLLDPAGSGRYRIPDVYVHGGNVNRIYDGTIGNKSWSSRQLQGFYRYSNGADIRVTKPTRLGGTQRVGPDAPLEWR